MAGTDSPQAETGEPPQPRQAPARAPLWAHLLALTLAAMLPLAVFSAGAMLLGARQERAAMEARMTDEAAQLAAAIDAELQRTVAMLEVVGRSGALARGDLREFHAFASRIVQAEPTWSNLQLLGPAGEHLVNARLPYGTALPALKRPDLVVLAATTGRPVVSELVWAVVAQRELTAIYVPLASDGAVHHVLAAGVEPANWQKLIESRMPPDMEAVLLDRSSVVITSTGPADRARPEQALRTSFVPSGQRLMLGAAGDARGVTRQTLNGVPVYLAASRAGQSGWTLVTFAPVEAMDGRLRASAATLGAGFAGLLLAGLLLAAWQGRRVSRAILSLVHGVQAVAAGRPPEPQLDRVSEVHQAREALLHTADGIAQQLRREAALRVRLEAHEKARNAFLAVLGHELRNPLAPLRNVASILKRLDGGDERVRQAASVLDRQTAQLARLVDDLLDVTRIQHGKIELRKELIDLTEFVRHAVADHRSAAQAAQIELLLEAPPAPALVYGDPARLTQVIGNLLTNACKFTPVLGTIRVVVEHLPRSVRVRVQDTGAGMDAETLRTIFEPFVQGPQDGARATGGLGLGLALVNALVRLHGGSVSAESGGPGKGAVFSVELPLADAGADAGAARRQPQAAPLQDAQAAPTRRHVLIVDDNLDGAQTLAQLVEALGHSAQVAGDVAAAMAACRERLPDLLLCDLALPGADGYSLARQVRADARLARIRLVALSGHAMPEHRGASAAAGFDLHLAKPASLEQVRALLE